MPVYENAIAVDCGYKHHELRIELVCLFQQSAVQLESAK